MNHGKRISVIAVLAVILLANFWLGSRYPAIDEKAAMAGEVVMGDVLSFDARFPVPADAPTWQKIGYSTANWIFTNRQGMTFGVLLATLILTLLRYWRPRPGSGNPFTDAIKGVLIGTPLGVCVNCAAPIAYGMRKQGLSAGTSLATMFASPTMNILVLAMTFSLLPLYMAITKIAVTLFFIVVLLPLIVRRWGGTPDEVPLSAPDPLAVSAPEPWFHALRGLAVDLLRSFWFIFIRTVPLMLLAGFLGAAMAYVVPLESLGGWQVSLGAMAVVALAGTFAPVPMAFDVVVVQALLMAGLAPPFAMVLLLTLGLFSIYPFLIVSRLHSFRFATQLFAAVAVLGFLTGYGSLYWEDRMAAREARIFAERFGDDVSRTADRSPLDTSAERPMADAATAPKLDYSANTEISQPGGIAWTATPFSRRSPASELPFETFRGEDRGLRTASAELMDFMVPFSQGRGLAAGDFDGDGLSDLAVANNRGIAVYRNAGKGSFEPVELPPSALDGLSVLVVAFADFDGDGCLDLFAGAVGEADFVIAGDCSGFSGGRVYPVPHDGGFITQAAAIADLDADGDLDILRGSWFFIIPRVAKSPRDQNHLVMNQGAFRFQPSTLDEIHGETLSVLASDLDMDGIMDMVIGNDYQEPDIFHRGMGGGEFEQWVVPGPVPISTNATMSLDTADFDNDGDFDLFLSGKVSDFSMRRNLDGPATSHAEKRAMVLSHREDFQQRYCALYEDSGDQILCRERFRLGDAFRRSTLEACEALQTQDTVDECMITIRIKNALVRRDWSFCPHIPADEFPVHRAVCDAYADYDAQAQPQDPQYMYLDRGAIPQKAQGNVLLVRQPDGTYQDLSSELGVNDAVWAWNARFADLDLDGWQDLYVTNGWWLETSMYSNVFFHNRQGKGFEAKQHEFGLGRFTKQHAFVLLDLENDGDLDVISRSLDGQFDVYVNGTQDNRAIAFEFRDAGANTFGIGNRVTIEYGQSGTRQVREIKLGGGFVSFDPPVAYFGLGEEREISRVWIDWSDGTRSKIEGPLTAGNRYLVTRSGL